MNPFGLPVGLPTGGLLPTQMAIRPPTAPLNPLLGLPPTSGVQGANPQLYGAPPGFLGAYANPLAGIRVPPFPTSISLPTGPAPPKTARPPGISGPKLSGQRNHIGSSQGSSGPTVTVFVGNITERASDMLIRQLLGKCGVISNWKRVQGANGKLQAFGFCEYADPEGAMRAMRLLNEFEIVDKKLTLKVDAKAKEKLDEYKRSRGIGIKKEPQDSDSNHQNSGQTKDNENEGEDELDEEQRKIDEQIKAQLIQVLREHEIELAREPEPKKKQQEKKDSGKPENLADMEMEDEKRNLIHREIDKFRDTYKNAEEAAKQKADEEKQRRGVQDDDIREQDRRRDESRSRSIANNDRDSRTRLLRDRERDRDRDRDRRSRDRERDRLSPLERRDRRSRTRDRDRTAERDLDHERDRERPFEDDDLMDPYERRKQERKLREKEASYQERLRNWEERENRKSKEYEREKLKEERKRVEEEKEIRRLKEFLEDYNDDKDDLKYYKGSSFEKKWSDRQREIERDLKDAEGERKELEELKRKLTDEGHPDPESEARKRLTCLLDTKTEQQNKIVAAKIKELMSEARQKASATQLRFDGDIDASISSASASAAQTPNSISAGGEPKSFGFAGMKLSALFAAATSDQIALDSPSTQLSVDERIQREQLGNKRKTRIQDVFNDADDEDSAALKRKRKLPRLEDEDSLGAIKIPGSSNSDLQKEDSNIATGSGISSGKSMSSEEKRKQIKQLIEKIPTSKDELFSYTIEWDYVDNNLMEKRIRPWINKKITEYIGEEEKALLDFICTKLQTRVSAQKILEDIAMVLDDEAEVFVVKMWRLLIYEIEAKKLGLAK